MTQFVSEMMIVLIIPILWSDEQITRMDFTFQVATSERHEPRRDEVVHVLASAAQVFFPIVPWWDKKKKWNKNIPAKYEGNRA